MKNPWLVLSGFLILLLTYPVTAQDQQPKNERHMDVSGIAKGAPFALTAKSSDTLLTLNLMLDAGWHMYGRKTIDGDPIEVQVIQGSCFEAAGKLLVPATDDGKLVDNVTVTLPIRRTRPGDTLKVRFSYTICDALQCLPPGDVTLTAKPTQDNDKKLSVLLAVIEPSDRTARIAAFLQSKGFDCTVTTFTGITAKKANGFDLVITDSPNKSRDDFRAAAKARKQVHAFPHLKVPIIATGFLGTELLEAHKIAAACGYI